MNEDNTKIAKASYEAFAQQDRTAFEKLVGPDFSFTSPIDNQLDQKTYFERCWPASSQFVAFDFIYLVPLGDQVFVTYEASRKDGTRFRNSEVLTIQLGKIVKVEVYWGWTLPHSAEIGESVPQEEK